MCDYDYPVRLTIHPSTDELIPIVRDKYDVLYNLIKAYTNFPTNQINNQCFAIALKEILMGYSFSFEAQTDQNIRDFSMNAEENQLTTDVESVFAVISLITILKDLIIWEEIKLNSDLIKELENISEVMKHDLNSDFLSMIGNAPTWKHSTLPYDLLNLKHFGINIRRGNLHPKIFDYLISLSGCNILSTAP